MKKLIFIILTAIMVSCNNEPSLQKYFVENSESSNFIALDITPSIINTGKLSLTKSDKEALNAFEKMNILAFKKDSLNDVAYVSEKKKVKELLNGKSYQELMRMGSGNDGGALYFVGEDDDIDEFVLFANKKENGFALVRILGDNMNPTQIMKLINLISKSDLNMKEFESLKQMIK